MLNPMAMKLSWNSLKISIAGARLSHLVQKDKIWDHGSMTEQVKNVFYAVEKAKSKKNPAVAKKYTTAKAFQQLHQAIMKMENTDVQKNTVLTQVAILGLNVATIKNPDRFTALIKGKRKVGERQNAQLETVTHKNFGVENFCEQWFFIRQGEWWLLDVMK